MDAQLLNVEYDTWADLGHRDLNVMIECFTMFAIIWSIGANCVKVRPSSAAPADLPETHAGDV